MPGHSWDAGTGKTVANESFAILHEKILFWSHECNLYFVISLIIFTFQKDVYFNNLLFTVCKKQTQKIYVIGIGWISAVKQCYQKDSSL